MNLKKTHRSLQLTFDIITFILFAGYISIVSINMEIKPLIENVGEAILIGTVFAIIISAISIIYSILFYIVDEGSRNENAVHQSWWEYMSYGGGYLPSLSVVIGFGILTFIIVTSTCLTGLHFLTDILLIVVMGYGCLKARYTFKEKILWKEMYNKPPYTSEESTTTSFKPRLFGN